MWKKILLFTLAFLVVLNISYSISLENSLTQAYLANNNNYDYLGLINLTDSGTVGFTTGLDGEAFTSDTSGYRYNSASGLLNDDEDALYSISFWFKVTEALASGGPYIVNQEILNAGDFGSAVRLVRQANTSQFYVDCGSYINGGANQFAGNSSHIFGLNEWIHVVFIRNTTGQGLLYINGDYDAGYTFTDNGNPSGDKTKYGLIDDTAETMDEIYLWNRQLDIDEITALYSGNGGEGCFINHTYFDNGCVEVESGETPSITVSTNLTTGNYTQNPLFYYISGVGTVANATDLWNISVYTNNSLYQVHNNVALNTSVYIMNLTYGINETSWNINIDVRNAVANDDANVTNVFIDSVLPELSLDTDFYNHSSFYEGSYLSFWYSWQDSNFLASNLTLFDVDRTTVLDNDFTENASNEGFYNTYSYLLGDSGFNRSIRLESWDSHTSFSLLYAVVEKNDSYLEYNNVKIISDAVLDYEQELDKISFTLDKAASYLCYETTGEWKKIENSRYPNHYVDIDNRVWVDDYDNTLVMETPQVLCTEEIKSLYVKSIGDLNYVSYTYFFDVVSLDTLYLENIDDNIGLIYGVMSMIPLLFLWIFIYTAAMILMLNFNFVVGSILWYFNYFLDFFVISEFFNLYTAARTGADWYVWAYGMFFVGLIIWLVIKLYIPFMLKQPRRT